MKTRKMAAAILGAFPALALSGCDTPTPIPSPIPVILDTPTPILTSTPIVLSDCFVSFHFAAWQDLDGDGLWGVSEPPLTGVKFTPPPGFAQIWGDPFLSEADGRLTIEAWSPGRCSERDLTITAIPPESYEPTTPASSSIALTSVDFSYEAQFGFRAVIK